MSAYYLLTPDFRNSVPESWEGFDLRGMSAGSRFRGCDKCGVQLKPCEAAVNQCPNCLGPLPEFVVTKQDLAVAVMVRHGIIVE